MQKSKTNNQEKEDQGKDNPALSKVIERNIRTIIHLRTKAADERSLQGRIADAVTSFSGRMIFVYVHIVWFGIWILLNTGWFGVAVFDPFPYGLLTMVVSLEAIFLSTFVLISQNRLGEETERRADLDLHIGLLTEHELTRVLQMLDAIQDKLNIVDHENSELADLEMETKPEDVLAEIHRLQAIELGKEVDFMSQAPNSRFTSEEEYRNIFEAASDGLIIYDMAMELVVEANPAACEMHGYTRHEFIGLNPAVFMIPESHEVFREHVRTAEPGAKFEAVVVHKRRDGTPFHVEVRGSAISYQGRLCLLSAIRDVSQRIQTEKILSGQIEARRREQATLLAISHTLASTLELQPGLILEQLREIIEYTHGGLFALVEGTLVTLAMRGTEQLEQSAPIRIHLNMPETLVTLFNRHQPIRIDDLWSDDPRSQFLRSILDNEAAMLLEGMQSWMWIPLAVRGRIIGGVGLAETTKNYFTAHHANLALSVANQAAITMINAELYEHAQELAVLEERQRLARNLHDAVNQSLFSAGLIAEVLPRLWDRDQAEARRSLEDLRRLTRGAMAEMRALLAELRPSTLTDSDLGDLLRQLGNALEGRTNLPVVVTVSGELILPAEVQVMFYRVCQEALNNIAKHAKASQVEINLKQDENVIELRIRDDGLGFDTEQTFSGHYGLGMMRERAEAAGALLTILSQPGFGTELMIRWITPEESV